MSGLNSYVDANMYSIQYLQILFYLAANCFLHWLCSWGPVNRHSPPTPCHQLLYYDLGLRKWLQLRATRSNCHFILEVIAPRNWLLSFSTQPFLKLVGIQVKLDQSFTYLLRSSTFGGTKFSKGVIIIAIDKRQIDLSSPRRGEVQANQENCLICSYWQ